MASITIQCVCIISCISQQGFCGIKTDTFKPNKVAAEVLIRINDYNTENVLESFDKFDRSKDSFGEGRKFLSSFLDAINSCYGLNLSIKEAARLVRENLHTLDMSVEMRRVVLNTIELYTSSNPTNFQHQQVNCSAMIATGISWPWEWNWFRLIKKQYMHFSKNTESDYTQTSRSLKYDAGDIELPADIYIGGAELLAGALCLIVGTVIPVFYAAGGALITDGGTRIINGVSQLGEEQRNNRNYSKPNSEKSSFSSIELRTGH